MSRLLIHTCCAPCMAGCLPQLSDEFDITSFFYNPNISNKKEHDLRVNELYRLAEIEHFSVVSDTSGKTEWMDAIRPLRKLGERSDRCLMCYTIRLEQTFRHAVSNTYDIVATTLTVSPHKLTDEINRIGFQLSQKYSISYLSSNFKKNNGFKISVEACKKYSFYRQNYCGCVYSQKEREKNSLWNR